MHCITNFRARLDALLGDAANSTSFAGESFADLQARAIITLDTLMQQRQEGEVCECPYALVCALVKGQRWPRVNHLIVTSLVAPALLL